MAKEKAIVDKIKTVLKSRGIWVTKLHGGPTQQSGLPDLLVVLNGRACFLEVKQPGCVATPIQLHTLEQLRKAGAIAVVVTSVSEALEAIGYGGPQ